MFGGDTNMKIQSISFSEINMITFFVLYVYEPHKFYYLNKTIDAQRYKTFPHDLVYLACIQNSDISVYLYRKTKNGIQGELERHSHI